MTTIKVLGTGCATCKRLLADVKQLAAKNNWPVKIDYVTDISAIMSYGVMTTPALVVDGKVLLTGNPGISKIEKTLTPIVMAQLA